MRIDLRQLAAIMDVSVPTDGRELQQFVFVVNWMRCVIPEFNANIAPLSELLEAIYKECGKRTKKAVEKVNLDELNWTKEHEQCFKSMKNELHLSATLAHIDPQKHRCLFTDASEKHWACVLTQIPQEEEDKNLPFHQQRHEPLSFISGNFKNSALRWCICDKEAYAIIAATTRLHYMPIVEEDFYFLLFTALVAPELDSDFKWPKTKEIFQLQNEDEHADEAQGLNLSKNTSHLLVNEEDAVWIPEKCTSLQLRICIIGH